eukprot:jgi/Bigna1/132094/aug1.16_g6802
MMMGRFEGGVAPYLDPFRLLLGLGISAIRSSADTALSAVTSTSLSSSAPEPRAYIVRVPNTVLTQLLRDSLQQRVPMKTMTAKAKAPVPAPASAGICIPLPRRGDTTFARAELESRLSALSSSSSSSSPRKYCDIRHILVHFSTEFASKTAFTITQPSSASTPPTSLAAPQEITYGQASWRMVRLGRWLIKAGVGCGERVGVLAPNSFRVVEAHYAVAGVASGIVLNCNQRLAALELAYILNDAAPVIRE